MLGDILFIIFLMMGSCYCIKSWAHSQGFSSNQTAWLFGLWVYHLLIGLVFYQYILSHGGDSYRYWTIGSVNPELTNGWWDYFGTSTYFMYWVNYPFSQIAGLGYLSGTILYASLSYFGFLLAFQLLKASFNKFRNRVFYQVIVLILFLPNVHFWTGGIGKEAFLWLGLVMVLSGIHHFSDKLILIIAGLLLSLMVRPIQGLVLTISVLMVLPFHKTLIPYRKKIFPLAIFMILSIFAYRYIKGSLIYGFNLEWIGEILDWQNQFLASFRGGSSVDMQGYNWIEKLVTVFFRPFIWEARDFWSLAAGIENTFLAIIFCIAVYSLFYLKGRINIPLYLWTALIYGMLLSVLYSITLNNLGIIMRMKSICIPFFIIIASYLYFEVANKRAKV
ncbi:hypothetical protein Q4534_17240 [Cyclobacterium sp. 1_MG-2023]|uniref:hypothetical protein n=1 Tax=Cyclobacterium sp. 1_MG-2023 TaxID=3062681 RepID=UPI0026E1DFEF|nr:hypothetical protein [Cyclobacterium sp. 1_MG-2023]MDO6439170.1 hypothetical protein [Cyclobacterium sp. 1_MG-2023]